MVPASGETKKVSKSKKMVTGAAGFIGFHLCKRLLEGGDEVVGIDNLNDYLDSNIYGFLNILEGCRHAKVKHLVFASSSSVYGLNTRMPFSVHQNVAHPISLYGATKKANELMAHSYSYF